MEGSPEQGLRAWVEYLRDMGVYDLYRHETPAMRLPDAVKQRLLASATKRAPVPGPAPTARPLAAAASSRVSLPRASLPKADPSRFAAPIAQPARASFSITTASLSSATRSSSQGLPQDSLGTEAELLQMLPPELAAPMPKPPPLETLFALPAAPVPSEERAAALQRLQAEIGDCTRCPLAYAGRHTIVFGEGDPNAKLMFVGEGPGADEDESGRPFVGKAGQLLNNMISAMGLEREAVYIANIVKCRPPGNRTPEFVEATTCSQFLLRQIDIVQPQIIVALGSTAATYLLGVRQSLASLRGQWLQARGAKVAVTYHPAFLLRDPRQKAEAWKDLQRVMAEMGLQPAAPRKS